MLKTVRVSKRLREVGITENHKGFPLDSNINVFGADTETVKGVPALFQIAGPPKYNKPWEAAERVTPRTIFTTMMDLLKSRVSDGRLNLVWFHNLRFDQTAIFFENIQQIYDQYNEINFERDGYIIKMLYGRVNKAQIWEDLGGYICPVCWSNTGTSVPLGATEIIKTDTSSKRVCTRHTSAEPPVKRNTGFKVTLLDSAAFCPPGGKSLAAALKIYGVDAVKMKQPPGIGERDIWDDPYARRYAMNDARVERELGLKILDLHKQYDVTVSVSLPQLAARILRHHFFKPKETLQFPPEPCRLASEFSYHAGKNGFYVPRGVYENVYEYDINSAFPKAMLELPQMVKGRYQYVLGYRPEHVGIYKISGTARGVKYPAIFQSDFKPIKEGPFHDVWATGFELDCLKRDPGYTFTVKSGWVWKPESNYTHSPLRDFVQEFWKLKNTTPKGPKRDTYKNILNSLYGKFAACVEKRQVVDSAFGLSTVNDPLTDVSRYFVAGALYHPFIASQITGYVRRELYNLEIEGEALHAATDSIKSMKEIKTSDDLGGVKLECFGRCYLFRTKLYLHFSKDATLCGHDLEKGWIKTRTGLDKIFDGRGSNRQHLCKYALHGFKGTVRELYERRFELLKQGYVEYQYPHMVSLREGIIRGETISTMIQRKERLSLVPV